MPVPGGVAVLLAAVVPFPGRHRARLRFSVILLEAPSRLLPDLVVSCLVVSCVLWPAVLPVVFLAACFLVALPMVVWGGEGALAAQVSV